ncbi:hypothetical protein N0V93_000376 [Gnomoniopsis smithogilvyi]|uniref:Intradiol ring-cleavage dioxygenases domain-containing protein n=1 Tax=Gnomoniopsis smithogilvyi TaxID=1191159 RepID=A0A9W8YZP4_9PEZI|nr:hypothetical protein N0V93_000376 [Gnomoniopsis smithogilvyi]
MRCASALASVAILAGLVAAHPGHDHAKEQAVRREFLQHTKNSLSHCSAKIKARGLEARNLKRREQLARDMAQKRGINLLNSRDLSDLNVSHLSTEDYDLSTSATELFSSNNSCVLSPEVTEGPYYVAGEYVRQNITDGQAGVDLTLDLQVLDIATCEPVVGVYTEIWHCNSTGVYSGVSANGNGNSATDTSNLDATFLRGIQQTDDDGVALFDTLVPGHYTGRTTHIHVLVHQNATPAANGTIVDLTASHVGQVFFDQSLITEVEATSTYSVNTQPLMTNEEDGILLQEAATSDPFIEYVLLGDTVEDGLLGWLAFGIDTNASSAYTVSAAATYYETGGETNSNGGGAGGPPGGGGPGAK